MTLWALDPASVKLMMMQAAATAATTAVHTCTTPVALSLTLTVTAVMTVTAALVLTGISDTEKKNAQPSDFSVPLYHSDSRLEMHVQREPFLVMTLNSLLLKNGRFSILRCVQQ